MVETATFRKHKIELSEYDCDKDIANRVRMSQFTPQDVEVLEEILYSSLRVPLAILEKNLGLSKKELLPLLEKLSQTGLFTLVADHVVVDKEMRKYYEFQVLKFEEDFKPGMDYFQGLLRKVPIHILPTWYAISRTSNNIFESIVEKYLLSPQIFQRYLVEIPLSDPAQKGIMNAVYQSPNLEVEAALMKKKFNLSQEEFERHMIELEFRLVCCVQYVREKDRFKEVITPFQEWQEYLFHVRAAEPAPIFDEEKIERNKRNDFAVIEEMGALLMCVQAAPISISQLSVERIEKMCPDFCEEEMGPLIHKLCALNLAERKGERFAITTDGLAWLKMTLTDRSLYLYRHPLNMLLPNGFPECLCQERVIREAEKSLLAVANTGWVFLEEFLTGIFIPLNEEQVVRLKRNGRSWHYEIPKYSEEEKTFFRALIQERLFELGITSLGRQEGRTTFRLTPFGKTFFAVE